MSSLSYSIAGSLKPILTLIASLVLWVVFIISQTKVSQPTMPLIIFKNSKRVGSYIGSLLFSAAELSFGFTFHSLCRNKCITVPSYPQ